MSAIPVQPNSIPSPYFAKVGQTSVSRTQRTRTPVLFSQNLAMLGFEPVKHTPGQNGKRGFKGIAVKPVTTTHRTEPQRYEDGGL
jgi:hypothetical protein